MKLEKLDDVLMDSLQDLYHAEKQITRALPKMVKAASDPQLQEAFQEHLEVTENQISRLEECFEELGVKAKAKACPGMQGIIEEGKELIESASKGNPAALDAALVAAAQKVEHYEISAYGSARTFAETLGYEHVAELLQQTLDEESQTNEKLTSIAEEHINVAALEPNGSEESDGEPASRSSNSSKRNSRSRRR